MVRIVSGAFAAILLSACASAPPTPDQLIVGRWTCKTESEGVIVDSVVSYLAGGKADGEVLLKLDQPGMAVNLRARAESTWAMLADGQMEETLTKVSVISGTMNGGDVPAAMMQPIIAGMEGQTTLSDVAVTATTLKLTEDRGTVTNCTR
jgi:hypothetical protein